MSLRCPACGSAFRGTCHSKQCEAARNDVPGSPDAAPPKDNTRTKEIPSNHQTRCAYNCTLPAGHEGGHWYGEPPPSDAAQEIISRQDISAIGQEADNVSGTPGVADWGAKAVRRLIVSHEILRQLYAHPEDAPEGPWRAEPESDSSPWWRIVTDDQNLGNGFTEKIAWLLAKALNREVRDRLEGDKTDG